MKFFTLPAALAAALFSAVVVIPFLPIAKEHSESFALEARLATNVAGYIQVYFDRGAGWSEAASVRMGITPSETPVTRQLGLPVGSYRAIRFDPLDREGRVVVESLRLVSRAGRVVRTISFSELKPVWQIRSLNDRNGRLEILTTPQANDPQLLAEFNPPLELRLTWRERIAGLPTRALLVFLGLTALLIAFDRLPALRRHSTRIRERFSIRPQWAIVCISAIAAVASMYPIIFLGKSYVSPNLGTVLLYETMPTLPGYTSTETTDVKGADIGAVMWWHLPLSILQHRALVHDHELPLWNRYNTAGTPLLGQGQSIFGDPLHFFVILAKGAAWAWDLKYLIAKWLFATGLGLLVFRIAHFSSAYPAASERSHRHLWPALLVAAAAPFFGFFLYRFNHPAFFSVCYAPWPLYCWLRVVQSHGLRGSAAWAGGLIAANFSLMNSGTAKEAYMLLLTMNFSGACMLVASSTPWRTRAAKFTLLTGAGFVFVLLSAPFWATFMDALGDSYTAYNAPSAFQIQPSVLLGAFDEIFYRPMMPALMTFNPSINFALGLGLLYFLATLRAHFGNRLVMALAASSLVPLAFAFGLVPPAWIVRVPFLGNVAHIDNSFSCALLVLWAVLGGAGFVQAAKRLGRSEGRGDLVVIALMMSGLVFAWIAFGQVVHRPIHGPTFTVNQTGHPLAIAPFIWVYLIVLLLASAGFALVLRRALLRNAMTPALALLGAVAFAALCWRHGLHASRVGFEEFTARPTVRTDFHAKSEAVEVARATQASAPSRVFGLRGNMFPGWTGVYGLEGIHAPDPLVNPFFRELTNRLPGIERQWDWRLYMEPATVATARPYLDALNVRYYFDLKSDQGLLGQSLTLLKAADLDVYESPTVWPRAFFTDRVVTYPETTGLVKLIGAGDGKPFAAVQSSDIPSATAIAALPRGLADRAVVPAANYRLTGNTTSFRVKASSAGLVVLNEVFWPGDFSATLNGRKVPVLRVNHAFKGVRIDAPGDYEISFRYRPRNFNRNLLFFAAGLTMLIVTGLSVQVITRRRDDPPLRRPAPERAMSSDISRG